MTNSRLKQILRLLNKSSDATCCKLYEEVYGATPGENLTPRIRQLVNGAVTELLELPAAAPVSTREKGSSGACRDCGEPLVPTGKRGRPKVRCEKCRTN